MKILLRIALFALCASAGILLAVHLASSSKKEETQAVAAAPASDAPVAPVAKPQASSTPQPEVAVKEPQPTATPKVAVASEFKSPTKYEPRWPRVGSLKPRVAQQVPDTSIRDSERNLENVVQQQNQARQQNAAAIEAAQGVMNGTLTPQEGFKKAEELRAQAAAQGGGLTEAQQKIADRLKEVNENAAAAQVAPQAGPVLQGAAPPAPGVVKPAAPNAVAPGVVETIPRPPAISAAGDGRLSIHSRDDDLRILLEQLGEQAGLNILACQSVAGTITVSLNDVSVDEALAVVLKISGYLSRREGNIVYIGTAADFTALEKIHDRITTRVYRPNYLTAKDLSNLLTPLITPGTGKISVTVPPAMGIGTDSTTAGGDSLSQQDAVVIQDYENVLIQIDQVIKELDRRPAQVSIEAVIVSVILDDQNDFGVDFQLLRDKEHVRFGWGSPRTNPLNGGNVVNPADGSINGEFKFDTGGLKFAFLDDSLGVFINALETVGDANIVASPKLLCLNKQKAEILIGQRLGYISTTVTQTYSTQNVEFLDVGTQLRLRPYISSDGLIRMEVHPELSTGAVTVQGGFTLPNKTLTEVTTNVMCPDGCTVIIGGLMREELTSDITQVPLLGSLPGVGPLFRNKSETVARTEILVLLTPRIIYDEQSTSEGEKYHRETMDIEAAKFHRMNPVGKAHLSRDYVLRANQALQEGRREAAQRFARLAVHYDPLNRDAVRLNVELNGGALPPLISHGLGATVVVGEGDADMIPPPAVDGDQLPEWMLNDLGSPPGTPPPIPSLPLHPRDPGLPGPAIDIQRPEVFRNDR